MTGSKSGIGSSGENLRRDAALEGLEVVDEHARELRGLRVVVDAVRPRVARLEDVGRHAGTARRNIEIEDRILFVRDAIERARQRRGNHRARVRDLHALADAVVAAGPAGIHEPDTRVVARNLLAEHTRIAAGVERQERRAEAGAERRLWFGDALFGACD